MEVNCTHCGCKHIFSESELKSDMSIKNTDGEIIDENPPVEVNNNTFIQCENCNYPMCCANAIILD